MGSPETNNQPESDIDVRLDYLERRVRKREAITQREPALSKNERDIDKQIAEELKTEIKTQINSAATDKAKEELLQKIKTLSRIETALQEKEPETVPSPAVAAPARPTGMWDQLSGEFEKVQTTVSTWLSGMGSGMLKGLKVLAGWFGWKEAAAYLDRYIEPGDIRDAMAKEWNVKVVADAADGEMVKKLKTQYQARIRESGGKLTDANYTFEAFYRERIDAMKQADLSKEKTYTIADLANFKSKEQMKEEQERNDKDIQLLKDAGAQQDSKGEWVIVGDFGLSSLSNAVNKLTFAKIDNQWQWKANNEPAWNADRFENARNALTNDQKKKRVEMNTLADHLKIMEMKPKEEKEPEKKNVLPENQEERKKLFITKLVEAFNSQLDGDVRIDPSDSWQQLSNRLIGALENEKFDTSEHQLEIDGGDLESTDTTSDWGLLTAGYADMDILPSWEKNIRTDPENAVRNLLDFDPSNLNTRSKNDIYALQAALRKEFPNL